MPPQHEDRQLAATTALLRLHEAQACKAERAFLRQQRRLIELRRELRRLEERCLRVAGDGSHGDTIRTRRTLSTMFESKIQLKQALQSERGRSAELLADLRAAQARRDAVQAVAQRRRNAHEKERSRREEIAGSDLVSSGRIVFRRDTSERLPADGSN